MWSRKEKEEGSALDLTPLVDVVFLLIIFFMLSTTFVVLPGIRIDLPDSVSETFKTEKDEIILTVDKTGTLYWGKAEVSAQEMRQKLRAVGLSKKDTLVLIEGDRGCGYGGVVDLLAMVRDSGLRRIAIVAEKQGSPDSDTNGHSP